MRARPSLLACATAAALAFGCGATPSPASAPGPEAAPAPEPPTDEELAAALLELSKRDQAARSRLVEAMASVERSADGSFELSGEQAEVMRAVRDIDAESTAFLRDVIATSGWPTIDRVGRDASHAAWLLAQHADAAPDLQAEVLALMEPLVASEQVDPTEFAYLTDRVRVARGEPQLYGTQFGSDEDGVSRPLPIEEPTAVDERRAAVGLETLAEYAESLGAVYGTEVSPIPLESGPGAGAGAGTGESDGDG
ncbi:MAG: DUF6624 domain-containing protein [Planctomycetota bacterium]